eukprot:5191384-Prymnesium_polylepis.1
MTLLFQPTPAARCGAELRGHRRPSLVSLEARAAAARDSDRVRAERGARGAETEIPAQQTTRPSRPLTKLKGMDRLPMSPRFA